MNLSMAVFLAGLEFISGTEAVINLLTIIQDHDFNVHLFSIQVKNIACCQKHFDRLVKKHKH